MSEISLFNVCIFFSSNIIYGFNNLFHHVIVVVVTNGKRDEFVYI